MVVFNSDKPFTLSPKVKQADMELIQVLITTLMCCGKIIGGFDAVRVSMKTSVLYPAYEFAPVGGERGLCLYSIVIRHLQLLPKGQRSKVNLLSTSLESDRVLSECPLQVLYPVIESGDITAIFKLGDIRRGDFIALVAWWWYRAVRVRFTIIIKGWCQRLYRWWCSKLCSGRRRFSSIAIPINRLEHCFVNFHLSLEFLLINIKHHPCSEVMVDLIVGVCREVFEVEWWIAVWVLRCQCNAYILCNSSSSSTAFSSFAFSSIGHLESM